MFLFESFELSKRSSEPKLFQVIRNIIAIILSLGFLFYIVITFIKFRDNFYPNVFISGTLLVNSYELIAKENFTYPCNNLSEAFLICPKYSNGSLSYNANNVKISSLYENATGMYNSSCSKFDPLPYLTADSAVEQISFTFENEDPPIYDYFDITFVSVFIIDMNGEITNKSLIGSSSYFVTRGQHIIYKFTVIKRKYYSSQLSGRFGSGADQEIVYLDIENKQNFQLSNATDSVLILEPKSGSIIYEEEKFQTTVVSVISSLGGFYGAISGIFFLLFGDPKLSPWGMCQTHCLCCWTFRRSFKKHLANRYISRAGIPLAEHPRNLPPGATIDDRVAVLEYLLKEYYIDASYLERLKSAREKHINIREEYNRLLNNNNSDADLES